MGNYEKHRRSKGGDRWERWFWKGNKQRIEIIANWSNEGNGCELWEEKVEPQINLKF